MAVAVLLLFLAVRVALHRPRGVRLPGARRTQHLLTPSSVPFHPDPLAFVPETADGMLR
jgi:hypothetical protein